VRIVHLTDLFAPAIGGTERHVEALARAQAHQGHEVCVVTFAHPDLPEREVLDDGCVEVRRISGWNRVLRSRTARPGALYHVTAPDPGVVRAIDLVLGEWTADIVHAHGWMAFSGVIAAGRHRTPLVWSLHDYLAVCATRGFERPEGTRCPGPSLAGCAACASSFYGPARGLALSSALRISRRLLPRVDHFVANSQSVADPIIDAGIEPSSVSVVAPVVGPISRVAPRPRVVPRTGEYLLYVGALSRHKGVPVLLEAYRRLQRRATASGPALPPLVMLGTRRDDLTTALPPGVVLHTDVPHGDVLAAWRHATIGLVPSVWPEPFGLVAVEAMAAGVPVVASRVGGLAEVVTDGVTGVLVEPGDAASLTRAIDGLLRHPDERALLGRAGMKDVDRFDAVSGLERVYRQVRSARPERAPG
jgi:glycosyltransferase involved in cell wall biosynthesis